MSEPTGQPEFLALRETHVAGILLAGERVFKFKKPVDFGFLDFRTHQARVDACQREYELNSRFSPDVYLGVARLALPASDREPDGLDEPVVVMCRMPDDRRLGHLVNQGTDVRDDLSALANRIAAVHDQSPRRDEIDTECNTGSAHTRARLRLGMCGFRLL